MGRLNRSRNAPAREPARCADREAADAVVAALTPLRGSSIAVMEPDA
jgi:hypothetical protein